MSKLTQKEFENWMRKHFMNKSVHDKLATIVINLNGVLVELTGDEYLKIRSRLKRREELTDKEYLEIMSHLKEEED